MKTEDLKGTMEIKNIKKELLKQIRGKRSQAQLSRILKYGFNQVYRWEADLTRLLWTDFIRICEVCKVGIKASLEESIVFYDDFKRADLLVQHIVGNKQIVKLADEIKISRFILSDWIKGKSEPTLDGILQLLASRDLLLNFIDSLTNVEAVSTPLKEKIKAKKKALNYLYENPLAGAVLACMELSSYLRLDKHSVGFIAKKMGISIQDEENILLQLKNLGLIKNVNGKYQKVEVNFNSRGDFSGEQKLRRFWTEKGLQSDQSRKETKQKKDKNYFGFVIFPMNEKKRAQLMEAYVQFGNTIYSIARDDGSENDEVMVVTTQLFSVLPE